jgi:hypothetical protein
LSIISLLTIIVLYSIILRTKDEIKQGFILLIFSLLIFFIINIIGLLEYFRIVEFISFSPIIIDFFYVLFILLFFIGVYKLRIIIKGISDYGQVLVLTSQKNLDDTIVKLIKNKKNICYITLERSIKDLFEFLDTYFINKSSFIFIDGTKNQGSFNRCINIENKPELIKTNLEKILKEKKLIVLFLMIYLQ